MVATTIRIHQNTKEDLVKLDFVKKNSFDEIIQYLIKKYKKKGSKSYGKKS